MTFDARFSHPCNFLVTGPTKVNLKKKCLLKNYIFFTVFFFIIIIHVLHRLIFFFFNLVRKIYMDQKNSSIKGEDFQKWTETSDLYILDK